MIFLNRNKKIIPLIVALLLITNVILVVVGNYTLFRIKNIIEGFYIEETDSSEISLDEEDLEKLKENQILGIINELYLRDVNKEDIDEGKYKGMIEALNDPYSEYINKEDMEDLMITTSGKFGGVGITVTPGEDGLITVVSPIEGTPGYDAGIKTGDKIVKVEGVDYFANNMNAAVNVMRGDPGTDVTITIQREESDGSKFLDITITRDIITIQTVTAELLDDKIGYIRVASFDGMTSEVFKEKINLLKEEGAEGFIIDLRGNPGGTFDSSIEIADIFLDSGLMVYTVDKNNNKTDYLADNEWINSPIVVLINEGSASASEIFAGAIQDNERGLIIGTNTFGKGIIQAIYPMPDGSGVKITTSEYFTPKGMSIHNLGIQPDIETSLNEEVEGIGLEYIDKDNQLQRAIDEIKLLIRE